MTKPTVAELAAEHDMHYLNGHFHSAAAATVRAVLRNDLDAAHEHAAEAHRYDRACRQRITNDEQAHANGGVQ